MKPISVPPHAGEVNALQAEARQDDDLVQTADGEQFMLTAVDDFSEELARTRRNTRLMAFLDERAKQPETLPLDAVKRHLGLNG